MKYRTGLFIGRFQPFHKGHLNILKKILRFVDQLIIGIGSANVSNSDNPLSYDSRKKIFDEIIRQENLHQKIIKIILIDDDPSDDVWLKKTLEIVGEFDTVIGNNEWTNTVFEKAGYNVIRPGYYRRNIYEGRKIRQLMKERKDWEERVPAYTISDLKTQMSNVKIITQI